MKKRHHSAVALLCVLVLTGTLLPLRAAAEGFRYGDPDGDGLVTAADARLVLRRSVKLDMNGSIGVFAAADVDADGRISAADARMVLRRSVNLTDAGWPLLPTGEVSFASVFKDTWFVGDSIVQSLTYTTYFGKLNAWGEIGAGLEYLEEMLPAVIAAKPSYVLLHFGMNRLDTSEQYLQHSFIAVYAALLEQLQTALPDTQLFVSSLFPISAAAEGLHIEYTYRSKYNEALRLMCAGKSWRFLDNEQLIAANISLLAADGMHPTPPLFTDIWLPFVRSEIAMPG